IGDPAPITLAGIEHAVLDGRGGNDGLSYTSADGVDLITHSPSLQQSSGLITAAANINGDQRMSLGYKNVATATFAFHDPSGNSVDILRVDGTAGNDAFTVAADG